MSPLSLSSHNLFEDHVPTDDIYIYQGPLLLTRFNFNPNMEK